jgi:PIN like domain
LNAVFFTDRDLGLQFPAILREARLTVERHTDHFAADCPDDEWLREVATHGWIALTHDTRILYKPNELAAVVEHKLTLLVIVGNAPYADLARSFVATLPRVLDFLAEHRPPVIGKVYRPPPAELDKNPNSSGRVDLWYPKESSRRP